MAVIIDRRKNPPGKSLVNRQRFLRRAKEQIKAAVRKSVSEKQIRDVGNGEQVKARSKDFTEPTFRPDRNTGDHRRVLPGNKEYEPGDLVKKPPNGGGNTKGKKGSAGDDAEDDFEFTISREEFLDYLFEDMELPDFIKEAMKTIELTKPARAGLTTSGSPANLNVERTFRNSISRRIALNRPTDERIDEIRQELAAATDPKLIKELTELLEDLIARQKRIPYIDENDLKYNLWTPQPKPRSQAVMFCLMDVSASMGEREKNIAKRYFLLLYLFLQRKYEKIEIRFVRHTTTAQEVSEDEFFYGRINGGTVISSGLELIRDIIADDYPVSEWNIYMASVSDGDNSLHDNELVDQIMREDLLPIMQYVTYVQVDREDEDMINTYLFTYSDYSVWNTYSQLSQEFKNMECARVTDQNQIWKIFGELFAK